LTKFPVSIDGKKHLWSYYTTDRSYMCID